MHVSDSGKLDAFHLWWFVDIIDKEKHLSWYEDKFGISEIKKNVGYVSCIYKGKYVIQYVTVCDEYEDDDDDKSAIVQNLDTQYRFQTVRKYPIV